MSQAQQREAAAAEATGQDDPSTPTPPPHPATPVELQTIQTEPDEFGRYRIYKKLPDHEPVLESVPMVLTQPGTPVSFRGVLITCYSISGNSGFSDVFHFRKTPELRCFRFPETLDSDVFRDFRIM